MPTAIPALQPIVHDLFVLRGTNKADAGRELETQKEVVVSMLLRLIQYHQVRGGGDPSLSLQEWQEAPCGLSAHQWVWLCASPGLLGSGEALQAEGLMGSLFKAPQPGRRSQVRSRWWRTLFQFEDQKSVSSIDHSGGVLSNGF